MDSFTDSHLLCEGDVATTLRGSLREPAMNGSKIPAGQYPFLMSLVNIQKNLNFQTLDQI